MAAASVGTVSGWPELTGNSNAELWGWFPDATAPKVEKIDKTSGAAITTFPETSLKGTPSAWAFAFYGGDYWVFLEKDSESETSVYQIDGTTGAVKSTTTATAAGAPEATIVGAGVSTCAPTIID
jgi:hypothetical protein